MKSIGFIDLYISEWHANEYPNWIRNANKLLGTDYEVKYVWAEKDISPVDGVTTKEWCEKHGAIACDTLEELCEKSDVLLLLAPSNPEVHLEYAKVALKYGKRIYIDKTFAPDYSVAKEIFKIAEENSTPFFSTSALRCADELENIGEVQNIIITGGGTNFAEYLIHLIEMAVKILKSPVERVKVACVGTQRICRLKAKNGTEAVLIFSPALGYSVLVEKNSSEIARYDIASDFFQNLLVRIVKFFDDGITPFNPQETLEVIRVRDAILKAESNECAWLEVEK